MSTPLRRAIVTGAQGFLASHLVRELERHGTHVTGLVRQAHPGAPDRALGEAPWDPDHLADIIADTTPDAVFHLAGGAVGRAEQLDAINVGLARALVAALGRVRTRPLLVCCGSAAEYGAGASDGVATSESAPCLPVSPYGRSKLAQTRSILAFGETTGARVLVARIFNLVGPGMPSHLALGEFARQIAAMPPEGGVLRTGDLEVARDFIDVALAGRALRLLAEHPEAAGVVNLCGGQATSLQWLTQLLIAASGRPVRVERDPARLRAGELRAMFGDPALLWRLVGRLQDTEHPAVARRIWQAAAAGATADGLRCTA